ncbi:MAG: hypothetical protein ABIQ59_12275 [Nocardioidaceae bacterium]
MTGGTPEGEGELVATHPSVLLDHYRVPHVQRPGQSGLPAGLECAFVERAGTASARVIWVDTTRRPGRRHQGRFTVAGCSVAGVVATDPAERLLPGRSWTLLHEVCSPAGTRLAAVWVDDSGDVLLPFDPGAVLQGLWSEAYLSLGLAARARRTLRRAAVAGYYAMRPLVPRALQLSLRRRLAHGQQLPSFPAWPLETGLHDLCDWFLMLLATTTRWPVPWIAPWPDGLSWALVLTHDVETEAGYRSREALRGPERAASLVSSWNFVPERYELDPGAYEEIDADGCEVGVHGLRHDGRDLANRRLLDRRAPVMREYARRWGAEGFRSPATQRRWDLMPRLGFSYDSSYADTDPYEPQPGGSCSYLPFFNRDLVELPITLPQDHTLFEILGHQDGAVWVAKSAEVRRRGGMVLALTHPDYAHGPALGAYRQLLDAVSGDPTAWYALPREVAAWWRDRAASAVVRSGVGWEVEGPARSRAVVRLTSHDQMTV